jgi:flagellar biosynthesis/type III secretory pathway M-ring protein FliF/YscJ
MNDLKEVILYTWKKMDKKKKIVAGVVLVIIIAFIIS